MFKLNKSIVSFITILILAIAVGQIQGQEQEEETRVVERDALSLTLPNPFGETPFLEMNDQSGPYFGLHIPYLWDFSFHWRDGDGLGNMKYDTNILSGLWHYTWDKTTNPESGSLEGPNRLSILGMTLWDNQEQPPAPSGQPATPPPQ